MSDLSTLTVLRRDEKGYEEARQDAVWNAMKPNRFPDVMALAETEQDVVEAVKLARENNWQIGIRSGGHAWVGSAVREGGMCLDLSRLNSIEVDAGARIAHVGPGARGQQIQTALGEHGLYFPTGTCPTVAVGGYLTGGGASFTSQIDGAACYSLDAIDVVTAEGELIIGANDKTHPEWMWAARGAGPGFFGAITRMHLKVKPLPGSMQSSLLLFPLEVLDEFMEWSLPLSLEGPDNLVNQWATPGTFPMYDGTVIANFPMAFGETHEETSAILEPLDNSPLLKHAIIHQPATPWTWDVGYKTVDNLYPTGGYRYHSDALWMTCEDYGFVEPLKKIIRDQPSDHSHVIWAPWREKGHPNAAYSGHTPLSIAVLGVSNDPSEDQVMSDFVVDSMEALHPYSNGIGKVTDGDLTTFPKYVLDPESREKLETLRAKYDSNELFHSFYGTPAPAAA